MSKLPETINVEHAFNPELRQAQEDMNSYIEQNPYQDVNGNFHNPVTGSFISKGDAEGYYSYGEPAEHDDYELKTVEDLQSMSENSFATGDTTTALSLLDAIQNKISSEELSITELVKLSAWAEVKGLDLDGHTKEALDTFMTNTDNALLDKIDNIGLKDENANRDGSSRDKSELDNYYDHVMELRDKYLDKLVVNGSKKKDGWKEHTTVEQATMLNDAWNKQTGQTQETPEADSIVENKPVLESMPASTESSVEAPEAENNETPETNLDKLSQEDDDTKVNNQGPSVDELTKDDPNYSTDENSRDVNRLLPAVIEKSTPERKTKKRRKILAAVAGLAALVGSGIFAANHLGGGDDTNANEAPVTTEVEDPAANTDTTTTTEAPQEETEATTEAPETETPETTQAELSDAEKIDNAVSSADEATLAPFVGIDAGQIQTGGDVMPFQNVDSWAPIEANLAQYNQAFNRNFVIDYDDKGQFKEGSHIINPAELAQYNELMKQLAEQANADSEE